MTDQLSVNERCACGATFDMTGVSSFVANGVRDWRTGHQHETPRNEGEFHARLDALSNVLDEYRDRIAAAEERADEMKKATPEAREPLAKAREYAGGGAAIERCVCGHTKRAHSVGEGMCNAPDPGCDCRRFVERTNPAKRG